MKNMFYAWLLLCVACVHITHGVAVPRPVKALYIDYKAIDWVHPELTVLESFNSGWNVIILSFYVSSVGPFDMAKVWQDVPSVTKQSVMNAIHTKGGIVLVSLGGATDAEPYKLNATELGAKVAKWALDNYLDGVDFDLENFEYGFKWPGWTTESTIQWVANLTIAARSVLGPNGIISHAPQSPYFGPIGHDNTWAGVAGGYTGVYQKASSAISFFMVQFYNQAPGCYLDYKGLFEVGCPELPSTSVKEIAAAGIPLEKIVVGKYINITDASNGWIAPTTLNQYISQAQRDLNWRTGVMAWAWGKPEECANWISTVYPPSCLA